MAAKLAQLERVAPEALETFDHLADRRLAEVPTGLLMKTGTAHAVSTPIRGWQGRGATLTNPRPPAVPATLMLSIEEYYAAAALMGLLAAQEGEPDMDWCAEWAWKMGRQLAATTRGKTRSRR